VAVYRGASLGVGLGGERARISVREPPSMPKSPGRPLFAESARAMFTSA